MEGIEDIPEDVMTAGESIEALGGHAGSRARRAGL
jgi:hypothetical protein